VDKTVDSKQLRELMIARLKALKADTRAAHWLAEANARQERGLSDETQLRKCQYWMDRATKLRNEYPV